MRAGLGIPYYDSDGSRASAFVETLSALELMYGWSDQFISDGGGTLPFNRAKARNEIVRELQDCDVIVLCDADSIPQGHVLKQAVGAAYFRGGMHFPFDVVQALDKGNQTAYSYGPSAGGCWVFQPQTWWNCGGMDERLGGWGTDDRAFLECVNAFTYKEHHPGILQTLWHSRAGCKPVKEQQQILQDEYLGKSKAQISANIRERGLYGEEPSWW